MSTEHLSDTTIDSSRPRPLSAIDIAILTLSDHETTARQWLRDIRELPRVDRLELVGHPEDAPKPLFRQSKMIDRDLPRIKGRQFIEGQGDAPTIATWLEKPAAETNHEPACWRFKNTCDGIDAAPRSVDHPLGMFTDAEMSMFDPVFQQYVKDCYQYGIPGYAIPPGDGSKSIVKTGQPCVNNGYCNDRLDRAVVLWGGRAGTTAVPTEKSAPTSPKQMPLRTLPTHIGQTANPNGSQTGRANEEVADNSEWWLSDEYLQLAGEESRTSLHNCNKAQQTSLPDPQAFKDAAFPSTSDRSTTALNAGSEHIAASRSSLIIWREQDYTPQRHSSPSSIISSDVAVVFTPLPRQVRPAIVGALVTPNTTPVRVAESAATWLAKSVRKLKFKV